MNKYKFWHFDHIKQIHGIQTKNVFHTKVMKSVTTCPIKDEMYRVTYQLIKKAGSRSYSAMK